MSNDLHFSSQARADEFLLDRQISSYKEVSGPHRVTRSRAKHIVALEGRRHALRAPVYKLPDEILAEIFKIGVIDTRPQEHEIPDSSLGFSFTVSWVVSRWRRVALDTPMLWNSFAIYLPVRTRSAREMYTTLLSRSQGSSRLLDLAVELAASMALFPLNYYPLKFDEVLERTERLLLTSAGDWLRNVITPINIPSQSFPSLMDLSLSNVGFRDLASFVDLLEAFPSLVTLKIELVAIDILDPSQTRVAELVQLKNLRVDLTKVGTVWDTHALLQYLKTPQVTELFLHNWDGILHNDADFSTTTELYVSAVKPLPQEALISLICGMPVLERLKLDLSLEDPHDDFPSNVAVPPLITIDFSESEGVDDLSRWLIDQCRSSLNQVSVAIDETGTPLSLSETNHQWIRGRGVDLVLVPRDPQNEWGWSWKES